MTLCSCGCGLPVTVATYTILSKGIIKGQPLRYRNGHTSRSAAKRVRECAMPPVNPTGLCMCGCGQLAPIASVTRYERGQVKGQPVRFINGHNRVQHTSEARQRIAEASRTRIASAETRARLSASKTGALNPHWNGGRRERRRRVQVYVGKTHPMANKHGYVFEHRLVMAGVIGRPLRSDEHVHHIDRDSLNNAPENLIIVTPSQHSRIHRLIDWHGVDPRVALARILDREKAAA